MRLTCPECGAVYEVPESAIPAGGRDVQCTNCGHGWFHRPGEDEPEEAEVLELDREEEEPLGPPPPVDPRLRRVLREEAEREVEARRAEGREGGRGGPRPVGSAHPPHEARRRADPRDLQEQGLSPAASWEERRPPRRRRRRGFGAGFLVALVLAAILAAAYVFDEELVEAAPSLAEPMGDYVEAVTQLRLSLDAAARDVAERVGTLIPPAQGG